MELQIAGRATEREATDALEWYVRRADSIFFLLKGLVSGVDAPNVGFEVISIFAEAKEARKASAKSPSRKAAEPLKVKEWRGLSKNARGQSLRTFEIVLDSKTFYDVPHRRRIAALVESVRTIAKLIAAKDGSQLQQLASVFADAAAQFEDSPQPSPDSHGASQCDESLLLGAATCGWRGIRTGRLATDLAAVYEDQNGTWVVTSDVVLDEEMRSLSPSQSVDYLKSKGFRDVSGKCLQPARIRLSKARSEVDVLGSTKKIFNSIVLSRIGFGDGMECSSGTADVLVWLLEPHLLEPSRIEAFTMSFGEIVPA